MTTGRASNSMEPRAQWETLPIRWATGCVSARVNAVGPLARAAPPPPIHPSIHLSGTGSGRGRSSRGCQSSFRVPARCLSASLCVWLVVSPSSRSSATLTHSQITYARGFTIPLPLISHPPRLVWSLLVSLAYEGRCLASPRLVTFLALPFALPCLASPCLELACPLFRGDVLSRCPSACSSGRASDWSH